MQCPVCGKENLNDSVFCQYCGALMSQAASAPNPDPSLGILEEPPKDSARARVLSALKDNLFLVICILFSACVGFTFIASLMQGVFSLPVLNILTVIFLWLTYAAVRNGTFPTAQFRRLSGVAYAQVVINWVLVALFALGGILFAVISPMFLSMPEMIEDILVEMPSEFHELLSQFFGNMTMEMYQTFFFMLFLIMGIAFVIGSVLVAIFNAVAFRKLHKFAKSIAFSVECDMWAPECAKQARVWLIVFGIFNGIGALGSLSSNVLTALANGSVAAAFIIASILVERYFKEPAAPFATEATAVNDFQTFA